MHDNSYPDSMSFAASGGMLGSGGAGTLPYAIPVPQSQQQQQQQQHLQHSQHPQPHLKHNFSAPMGLPSGLVGGGGSAGGGGGPAVPAPRSAATLLAEATGAPPPPPAPLRIGGVQATMNATVAAASAAASSGLVNPAVVGGGGGSLPGAMLAAAASMQQQPQQQLLASLPPAPAPSKSAVAAAAARMSPISAQPLGKADKADGGATASVTAAPLVTAAFQSFTPAAAAMLGSMTDGEPFSGPAATAAAPSAASPPASAAAPAASCVAAVNPSSKVEVEFSLPAVAESGSAMWGTDVDNDEDPWDDVLLGFLVSLKSGGGPRPEARDRESMMEDESQRWYLHLLHYREPSAGAAAIQADLAKHTGNELNRALECLAGAMVMNDMWIIVPFISPRLRRTLRLLILRFVLKQLIGLGAEPQSADRYAAVLAKMVAIRWVTVTGAVRLVDQLLEHAELAEVGVRTAATLLLKSHNVSAVRAELQARPRIAFRLANLYETSRSLGLDVAVLCRWWRGIPPSLCGEAPLLHAPDMPGGGLAPVTTMAYFAGRDELVTGDMSGAVTLWGPPTSIREKAVLGVGLKTRVVVHPRGVVPLPMNCVPVAMAGQRLDGQYLAIAGMPLKGRKPYSQYNRAVKETTTMPCSATTTPLASAHNRGAASAALADAGSGDAVPSLPLAAPAESLAAGAIIVITCNENSIRWNKGEIIMRPPGVAITAITAFRNSIVAVGESVVSCAAPGPAMADPAAAAPHRLSFVDVVNGTVMRRVPQPHEDFITAMTVLEESSYVLLSGGRDAAVKLWDPRSREDCPVVNTALCVDAPHHETTISTLHTYGFNILSTDVDGVVAVWDLRKMAAPQLRRELCLPIADATLLHANRAALATPRGIVTIALDTLHQLDLGYERGSCTHVLANDAGTVLFTANDSNVTMLAVGDM